MITAEKSHERRRHGGERGTDEGKEQARRSRESVKAARRTDGGGIVGELLNALS